MIDAPRHILAHLPTPLEPLAAAALFGPAESPAGPLPTLWIKRDDCTGLAIGGNKTRKLEYLIGAARAASADTIVSFGALQSNHARQTAAACARAGLACELVLTDKVADRDPVYHRSGNLLLDEMLGARVHRVMPADFDAALAALRDALARAGRRVHEIPVGGSDATGALGYVRAAHELLEQLAGQGVRPDAIVCASASGGTHAGLLAGLAAAGCGDCRVIGVDVSNPLGPARDEFAATIGQLAAETLQRLGSRAEAGAVTLLDGALGAGYGQPFGPAVEASRRLAGSTGVLTDPVYSGKALYGLRLLLESGVWRGDEHIVFLHTGGTPALFAYPELFTGAANGASAAAP